MPSISSALVFWWDLMWPIFCCSGLKFFWALRVSGLRGIVHVLFFKFEAPIFASVSSQGFTSRSSPICEWGGYCLLSKCRWLSCLGVGFLRVGFESHCRALSYSWARQECVWCQFRCAWDIISFASNSLYQWVPVFSINASTCSIGFIIVIVNHR